MNKWPHRFGDTYFGRSYVKKRRRLIRRRYKARGEHAYSRWKESRRLIMADQRMSPAKRRRMMEKLLGRPKGYLKELFKD